MSESYDEDEVGFFDSSIGVETKMTLQPVVVVDDAVINNIGASGGSGPLFFDIETIPSGEGACPKMPGMLMPDKKLPGPEILAGTIKDIDKLLDGVIATAGWRDKMIAAEIADKNRAGTLKTIRSVTVAEEQFAIDVEAWCKSASTTPEYLKIIGLGWRIGDGPIYSMVAGTDDDTEEGLLRTFWNLATLHRPLCGYNCRSFDLPAILVRSALLGITDCVFPIDRRKYGNREVLDLFELRFDGAAADTSRGMRGMKEWAKMVGINPPSDLDGGKVFATYQENPEKIHDYVQSDIWTLSQLHKKFANLLW